MHSRLNIPAPAGVKIGRDAQRKVIRQSNAELRARPEAHGWVSVPRKVCSRFPSGPYRKPTQVGESNRLRRASETSLRNSAH